MSHRWTLPTCLLLALFVTSRPAQAQDVVVDFTSMGTLTTSTLSVEHVDITADDGALPAQVFVLNLNGIGVLGGGFDSMTDGSEALHFDFQTLVTDVEYHVFVANNLDADGKVGEAFLEAFVGASSLGVLAVDDVGWKDVTAMFGVPAITGFTVRADVDGQRISTLRYDTTWSALGPGLAGTHGVPTLEGTGFLVPGLGVGLDAAGLLENVPATLVIGFTGLGAPFKGGIMVPEVDLLIPGLPTGPTGTLSLAGTWPAGIPSGFSIFLQLWLADPAGPQGFAATNGVRGDVP